MRKYINSFVNIQLILILFISMCTLQLAHAQSAPCTAVLSTGYVNSYGRTYIAEDSNSRYVYQYMWWHDLSRLEWFRRPYAPGATFSAGTWELQTLFYNYDGNAYGNAPSGYWASDLPYPYVDTQAFDSANEKNITIGSAHAYNIQPGRYYYYVTRFTNGGGSSSWVKVQAQRGLRQPTWCYTTWCAFSCSSQSNNENVVPFQSRYTAPGCRDYWWQWSTTTDKSC